MFEPFYSVETILDEKTIVIGVDDSVFSMKFQDADSFSPMITPGEKSYTFMFYNIYKGIDIKYVFKEDSIKETIIVKNKDAIKGFSVFLDYKKCEIVYDHSGKKYRIIDNYGNEIFIIEDPYVISGRRRDYTLKDFVKMSLRNGNEIVYSFSHLGVNKYPVYVDPTFIFNTKVQKPGEIFRDDFDRRNIMLVTSKDYGVKFLEEIQTLTKDSKNKIYKLSDDVLFSDTARLYFPWLFGGGRKVTVAVQMEDESVRSSQELMTVPQWYLLSGSPIYYSYVDVPIPFTGAGSIKISCRFAGGDSPEETIVSNIYSVYNVYSVYGAFSAFSNFTSMTTTYNRTLTFMPKIDISFPIGINFVKGGLGRSDVPGFSVENLKIENKDFMPWEYYICPYTLNLSYNDVVNYTYPAMEGKTNTGASWDSTQRGIGLQYSFDYSGIRPKLSKWRDSATDHLYIFYCDYNINFHDFHDGDDLDSQNPRPIAWEATENYRIRITGSTNGMDGMYYAKTIIPNYSFGDFCRLISFHPLRTGTSALPNPILGDDTTVEVVNVNNGVPITTNELKFYTSEKFKRTPHIMDNSSHKVFKAFVSFQESEQVPLPHGTSISGIAQSPLKEWGKSSIQSFVNEMNISLKSAVNERTNVQEKVLFQKRYVYVSPKDFTINRVGGNSQDLLNVVLRPILKTFFHFSLKTGEVMSSYFSYAGRSAVFSINEHSDGYTSVVFNTDVFTQVFDGAYDGNAYKSISQDILMNSFLYADIGGLISRFRIIYNSEREIRLYGHNLKGLLNANSFCISFFNPKEAYFVKDYQEKDIFKLKINSINSSGNLVYDTIPYNTLNIDGLETICFVDEINNFVLSKNINLFSLEIE